MQYSLNFVVLCFLCPVDCPLHVQQILLIIPICFLSTIAQVDEPARTISEDLAPYLHQYTWNDDISYHFDPELEEFPLNRSAHHSSNITHPKSPPPNNCSVALVSSRQSLGRLTAASPFGSSASGTMCENGTPSIVTKTRHISYFV